MGKKYIHYGNDHFDLKTFDERCTFFRNRIGTGSSFDKPVGFWASPVDAEFGWKDWCEGEDFHTERLDTSFTFELDPSARVLEVRSFDDVADYVCEFKPYPDFPARWRWDFDKLYRDFDAVELFLSENWRLRDMHMFYAWDVDSIVIWNPDVIMESAKQVGNLLFYDGYSGRHFISTEDAVAQAIKTFFDVVKAEGYVSWDALFALYGNVCPEFETNNWRKRHGYPMKRRAGRR